MSMRPRLTILVLVLAFALAPPHASHGRPQGLALLKARQISVGLFAFSFSAVSDQSTVVVTEQDVSPHFPEKVDFTLKASGFTAERAEMNYRLVGEAVTVGVAADLAGPTDRVDTTVTLDLRTDYIPPGAEVAYYWKLTSPTGDSVDTTVKTFQMQDEGFNWRSLTDKGNRVNVHWYDGDAAFGQKLLEIASSALDRLETQIGAGLDRRAEIWVYANGDALFEALPLHQPEWVGGQAYPDLAVVLAAIPNDDSAELEIKRSIPHEISHLVLYQATKNPYNTPPSWLDEGLAVHNQEVSDPFEEEALRKAVDEGTLIPLKALAGSFGADENEAFLSYAESASVVDFILGDSRFGADRLAKTVAAFKRGVTYDDALETGLGVTTDELDRQWRAWLPYKPQPTGSAPAATEGLPTWLTPLVYIALGILAALFVAGGLITVFTIARRGAKRKT